MDERYHYTASCRRISIPIDLFEEYSKKSVEQLLFITAIVANLGILQELIASNVVAASASERVIQSLSCSAWICARRRPPAISYQHERVAVRA